MGSSRATTTATNRMQCCRSPPCCLPPHPPRLPQLLITGPQDPSQDTTPAIGINAIAPPTGTSYNLHCYHTSSALRPDRKSKNKSKNPPLTRIHRSTHPGEGIVPQCLLVYPNDLADSPNHQRVLTEMDFHIRHSSDASHYSELHSSKGLPDLVTGFPEVSRTASRSMHGRNQPPPPN